MRRFRPLLTLLVAVTATACSGSSNTPTDPTPTPTEITEPEFTGTLEVKGAATKSFTVGNTGLITIILEGLAPPVEGEAIPTVSLQLGTFNAGTCQVSLFNDSASNGSTMLGLANVTGDFCVRIADSGKLTAPTPFTIKILHF
jgi:hypothetical protein